jgi:hypothetical protein
MIRRSVAFLLALVIALVQAGTPASASNAFYSSGTNGISVTATNTDTAIVLTGTSTAFNAQWILVRSRSTSANACALKLCRASTCVAAATDMRLGPGESVTFTFNPSSGGDGWSRFGAKCAAAETATWDVDAGR